MLERRVLLAAIPVGPEFRVNTFTAASQRAPDVAMDADGDFVVVWQSQLQDGSGLGVFAQRFSADGEPQGGEIHVNTYTTNHQSFPSVAMDADGDFVVAWQSLLQDGSDDGIYAQRFNAAGVKQGAEFRVNQHTTHAQTGASVAMDADGDFIVAWGSFLQAGPPEAYGEMYARRYNAAGVPQGDEFRVNSFTTGRQAGAVAMHADGSFIAAWHSAGLTPLQGIYARRYDAAGAPQGAEFPVHTTPAGTWAGPDVAVDAQGGFVVAWSAPDGDTLGVFAQRFNAQGARVGDELRVNTNTTGSQWHASVGVAPGGAFVVTWHDHQRRNVYGQSYTADGAPSGGEFLVNTFTTGLQETPRVAMDGRGHFTVTWTDWTQDGDDAGVYAQRFEPLPAPAVTASDFRFETAPQRLTFSFNQDVSASLGLDDLQVRALPSGTTVTPSGLAYDPATNTATVTFASILPDADYRATLIASGIIGPGGALPEDHVLDFYFLGADANRDRRVNLDDFNVLAANFGQTGRTFSQGNFNYDAGGNVNLDDFNILAARFGTLLASPGAGTSSIFGPSRLGDSDKDDLRDDVLA